MGAQRAAWLVALRAEYAAYDKLNLALALLDLVKAFETVPHRQLTEAAKERGYSGTLLRLSLAAYRLRRAVAGVLGQRLAGSPEHHGVALTTMISRFIDTTTRRARSVEQLVPLHRITELLPDAVRLADELLLRDRQKAHACSGRLVRSADRRAPVLVEHKRQSLSLQERKSR